MQSQAKKSGPDREQTSDAGYVKGYDGPLPLPRIDGDARRVPLRFRDMEVQQVLEAMTNGCCGD